MLQLLSKLGMAGLFQANSLAQATEDDWPPICMAGHFDFSRGDALQVHSAVGWWRPALYIVQVLCWCLNWATCLCAGVSVASVDVLRDREGITGKGPEALHKVGSVPTASRCHWPHAPAEPHGLRHQSQLWPLLLPTQEPCVDQVRLPPHPPTNDFPASEGPLAWIAIQGISAPVFLAHPEKPSLEQEAGCWCPQLSAGGQCAAAGAGLPLGRGDNAGVRRCGFDLTGPTTPSQASCAASTSLTRFFKKRPTSDPPCGTHLGSIARLRSGGEEGRKRPDWSEGKDVWLTRSAPPVQARAPRPAPCAHVHRPLAGSHVLHYRLRAWALWVLARLGGGTWQAGRLLRCSLHLSSRSRCSHCPRCAKRSSSSWRPTRAVLCKGGTGHACQRVVWGLCREVPVLPPQPNQVCMGVG